MRISSFHSIVLLALGIASCATVPEKMALAPLPARWIARTHEPMKSPCSARHKLPESGFFQLCSGSPESKASGVVRFFDKDEKYLSELSIATRDALALSASVSQESAWEVSSKSLFVGTHDGRILKFNFQGELLGTHLLKMPTWVQHLSWHEGALLAVASRHESVTLLKLSNELLPLEIAELSHEESEAEWALGKNSLYLTTNKGTIYHFDRKLKLLDSWNVGPERELGKPLLVRGVLWVGDSEGFVYRVSSQRLQHVKLGVGPVSSAPVRTQSGVWLAFDEEGALRLVDGEFKVLRTIKLPITRSFTGFESLSYHGHTLLRTSSQGIVTLLSAQGEILISAEGEESEIEFEPQDNLAQERLPASGI